MHTRVRVKKLIAKKNCTASLENDATILTFLVQREKLWEPGKKFPALPKLWNVVSVGLIKVSRRTNLVRIII